MESAESGSLDDSKNLETEEIVAKYDEDPEALSSQNEEDQGGEQVYGYLYRSDGSEDATIFVDSRGFNLNGQSLIVTQNGDGNEIIVLVEDPETAQSINQTFALQPEQVSFEDGLKEHGPLMVDQHSQRLEFIKSPEEEQEEAHSMYIENSGEILNISSENPVVENPLWPQSEHLRNDDGTEMLFIPNPTVVLAPEESKHRKLMQLACIAHEIQSAGQKSTVICDPEASLAEYDKATQVDSVEEDKSLPNIETEVCINYNGNTAEAVSSPASVRAVDNTVSVIHSTSSEIQGNSLENHISSPDFSPEKNAPDSENDQPSEVLYANVTLDASSCTEQLEECSKDSLEGSPLIADERYLTEDDNNDSPLIFIEKSHDAENRSDVKMDEDSHASSPLLVIEDENPKSHDSDSSMSLRECSLSKDKTSFEDKIPCETHSELDVSDIDDDNLSSAEHSVSVSENESSFLHKAFNYEAAENNLALSRVLQDGKPETSNAQSDLNELNMEELKKNEVKTSESVQIVATDSKQSHCENLDSVLVIAETIDDAEIESTKDDFLLKEGLELKSIVGVKELVSSDILDPKSQESEPKEFNTVDKVRLSSSPSRNAEDSKEASVFPAQKSWSGESNIEYPSVKRVSKTYISKKKMMKDENKAGMNRERIELFTGDDVDLSGVVNSPKDSCSSHENNTEPDDNLISGVQSKVSAERTYSVQKEKYLYKKKRCVPPKQGLRSHSLRARSSSALFLKNGNTEVSDSKKSCLSSSSSENLPWAKVLLETSFELCTLPNDAPSTSFASQYPKETSTPLLSPEQRLRKLNKYKRDFDRLLNSSSPIATKQPKVGKKHSSKMHPNVIKATKSKYSSAHSSRFSKSASLPLNTGFSKRYSGKKVQKPKEASIKYLWKGALPNHSKLLGKDLYLCGSCNFSSVYVDNLIEHLKYCSSRQPILGYEVNNMDKRQRIRGEEDLTNTVNNALKKIRSDLRSALMDEDDPSLSFPGGEEEDIVRRRRKSLYRQYGYGDDDVVWVKFKNRFWPALVLAMDGTSAFVKLISYPKEMKGLKVTHDHIQTFDNSKWNLLCLAEAESLPHNEIFVKAVQSCERFMSKKFLGVQVTGKEFFSVRDEVDFAVDNVSSEEDLDCELERICSEPARKARYETLDSEKVYQHVLGGKADDYVLDIYYRRRPSRKHLIFFEGENSQLNSKPWYGPFEDLTKFKESWNPRMKSRKKQHPEDDSVKGNEREECKTKSKQEEMFQYLRELFLKKVGKKTFVVSYVCHVWLPEAIVQALSVVKDIPLKDAELLLESEDSMDLDHEDPSVEEILKKYS